MRSTLVETETHSALQGQAQGDCSTYSRWGSNSIFVVLFFYIHTVNLLFQLIFYLLIYPSQQFICLIILKCPTTYDYLFPTALLISWRIVRQRLLLPPLFQKWKLLGNINWTNGEIA